MRDTRIPLLPAHWSPLQLSRTHWARRIEALDPATQYRELYELHASHEFPWDTVTSLSFALFRTFAVPSIGELLDRTGEFTGAVQKRYDDTGLLLDAVVEHGFDAADGRAALRRINQMHRSYDISNDDMRYVLATFVVVPVRWNERFGWRRLGPVERAGMTEYYRELGRHLGIRDVPVDYEGFARLFDDYERDHFAFDAGARRVADATLRLMTTFRPYRWVPRAVATRLAYALMDEPLLEALHYPRPTAPERWLAAGVITARARVVACLPRRMRPLRNRDQESFRSYPGGADVRDMGTFPVGCPVPHPAAREAG